VDTIYGHLLMARRNVAAALVDLIDAGVIGESAALDIGRLLFLENPAALYGLEMPTPDPPKIA
jgi:hypothetical protein